MAATAKKAPAKKAPAKKTPAKKTPAKKTPAKKAPATAPAAPARFEGIPAQAFEFFDTLGAHNTREWWAAHKGEHAAAVRDPLVAMLAEVSPPFGEPHLFRPHRDTRFSKDKSPIKDHQGAFIGVEDGVGYYLQINAERLMTAGGWYSPEGAQVRRFREAVDSAVGAQLEGILAKLRRTGWEIDGRPLKTRPRDYPEDHPRLGLLRFRALTASRSYPVQPWLGTRTALTTVRKDWRALEPLVEWLGDHVGPATDPADGLA